MMRFIRDMLTIIVISMVVTALVVAICCRAHGEEQPEPPVPQAQETGHASAMVSDTANYAECEKKPEECKGDMLTQEQADEAAKVEPGAGEVK